MKEFIKLSELKLQKSEMLKITGGAKNANYMPAIRLYGIVVLYAVFQPKAE